MGDEDNSESHKKLLQRRPKIIIRKCKKSSKDTVSKPSDDSKKINGELLIEDKVGLDNNIGITEPQEQDSKSENQIGKRKAAEELEEDDCIVVESNSSTTGKEEDENDEKEESLSLEFKGFKKRIIAQTEKLKDDLSEQSQTSSPNQAVIEDNKAVAKSKSGKLNKSKKKNGSNVKKNTGGDGEESQAESQTEYAQYLGLQPTMQFKCYRCGEKGFPSMFALNMHQRGCGISQKTNFLANLQQDTSNMSSSDPNMLTNFRITRKVYLCSACGTYYENWNLFLHMRDVHKKHICLYCLTMFTVANKLADHLQVTHNVQENSCKNSEEFQNIYKGSCYLICCSCENMFNERDDYHNHECVKKDLTAKCSICGVKCGHYYTCPNSNLPRTSANVNVSSSSPINKSQVSNLSKSVTKIVGGHWTNKKSQGGLSSDNDDDYDISNAASFCHVDIADELSEKNKSVTEENVIDITEDDTSNEMSKPSITPTTSNLISDNLIESDESRLESSIQPETCGDNSACNFEPLVDDVEKSEEGKGNQDSSDEKHTMENQTVDGESECNILKSCENNGNEHTSSGENDLTPMDGNEQEVNEKIDSPKSTGQLDSTSNEISKTEEKLEINDSNKLDTVKSQSSHLVKTDAASSDSERDEHTVPLSVSQDDSESSSDASSDEDDDNKSKKSAVQEKNTSAYESDDSEKSALIVDEKHKTHSNENTQDLEHKNQDTASGEESLLETKSITSNDASKDFLLDDYSSTEKLVQKTSTENESGDVHSDEICPSQQELNDGILLAGDDVPAMALTLEDKLDIITPQAVVKECVRTSCLNCVYCSHAVKIAVNGKQLALHLLAEHRYKPIKNNETSQDVIKKLKTSLVDLENIFFNTESYDSSDKSLNSSYDHTYECFQCRFMTTVHKELYIHKRKMHQKTVLLCVMCKANFYSYSELLCHMCPGIYVSEDVNFRCCFCNLDMIPSAFRLMVHLRKSHHTCDICLEIAGDQQKLSTHMWKHKLNHLCYRCGIAYRNKPDITKHLFWKHGTESVLCKKCLQKKWPHVYHFCIPPTVFICEECNASFTKAVALKVHKRYHGGELPYGCSKCEIKFVSKKLLAKHEDTHNKPLSNEKITSEVSMENKLNDSSDHINVESVNEPDEGRPIDGDATLDMHDEKRENTEDQSLRSKKKKKKDKDRKEKTVVDVYNLPPLNLSSESDSSDEETKIASPESLKETKTVPETEVSEKEMEVQNTSSNGNEDVPEENQTPAPIVDGVWDNFHSYKAELEKRESKDLSLPNILPSTSSSDVKTEISKTSEPDSDWFLLDHSYCLIPGKSRPSEKDDELILTESAITQEKLVENSEDIPAPRGHSSSIDHAYATTTNSTNVEGTSSNSVDPEKLSHEVSPSTPPPQVATVTEPHSSPKKKLKSPKKKKHIANSSSSSDSSSDSDSSSCTCGPDCSCSNTSSSSSSSSSDSESSTSEGRQRAAERREKKKEKLKHNKHQKEEAEQVSEVTPTPPVEEEPVVDAPAEPMELPIRESDLDTDESSTDEDFYDKCPQSHAKQQIENRNKLMLLASVAPVNNGSVSPPPPPPPPIVEKPPPPTSIKRKTKTKRRRKSQQSKKPSSKANQPSHQSHPNATNVPINTSNPSHFFGNHLNPSLKLTSPLRTPVTTLQSDVAAGSGSENESTRLSKRKRVRNKFYGYSSDEEEEKPSIKWRKAETTNSVPSQIQNQGLSYQQSLTQQPELSMTHGKKNKPSESSGTEEEQVLKRDITSNSSSSSSESETEIDSKDNILKEQTEKSDNLYCYCQCPYDEVSEMIACDGQDCTIEWFHFECVGIMVPPKGKWYCPDCRKRRDLM